MAFHFKLLAFYINIFYFVQKCALCVYTKGAKMFREPQFVHPSELAGWQTGWASWPMQHAVYFWELKQRH